MSDFTSLIFHWLYTSLCVDHNKLWEILKVIEIPNHLTCLPRNLYAVKKKQLKPNIEQLTGSKLGEDYDKAVYCHPAYLTYMQRPSCKILCWMNHKLESRLLGEQPQICGWYHSNGRKWRTEESLDECERGEWKSWNSTLKILRSWHPVPSLYGK